MNMRHLLVSVSLAVTIVPPAQADEVTDQIERGLEAYRKQDPQGAIRALESAANLLRQSRADALKALLPSPPPGWTADPAETTTLAAAMLGGGTSASRTYHNGIQQVQIQITSDNPML
ncbi:MAG: hypothetical protein JO227_15600, partial [Acetobacteraceae bacterium]|nr:hypothetical protein [Acetobacteraceae bacterium]